MTGIEGMGKDAPMEVKANGAKTSTALYRFDLLDPKAMFAVSRVLSTGAQKYGEDNWRLLDIEEHINHAIAHLYAWLAGDRTDDHLVNATCRAIFALGNELTLKEQIEAEPSLQERLVEQLKEPGELQVLHPDPEPVVSPRCTFVNKDQRQCTNPADPKNEEGHCSRFLAHLYEDRRKPR